MEKEKCATCGGEEVVVNNMKKRYGAKFVEEDFETLRKLAKKTKRSLASFIDEGIKMVIKKYAKRYLQKNKRNEIRETYAWKKIVQRNKG